MDKESRKLRTYTGHRLEVVDEILSLLVSRPVTLEVECREAGLFVLRTQQGHRNDILSVSYQYDERSRAGH
jgi:hypothetical protein